MGFVSRSTIFRSAMGMTIQTGRGVASCSAMPGPAAPARPPAPSTDRPIVLLIALGVVVAAALGAAAFLVFGGDDGGGGASRAPLAGNGGDRESGTVQVQFEPTEVLSHNGGGPPVQLSPEQVTALVGTARQYLDGAVIEPLRSGEPAADISGLFDAATAAQLTGLARPALFEEGLPPATGGVDATTSKLVVNGLSDGSGAFVLATVGSDVEITAATDEGDLRIHRITELTLVPDGVTWKIAGFEVIVDRQGPGVKKPAATASSTGAQ
jgi:hypothetical protein